MSRARKGGARPMAPQDPFADLHPAVEFVYFGQVLVFTMFFMHPVSLCISLGAALAYTACRGGGRQAGRSLCRILPVMALAALANPAFNHAGTTVLAYLPSGNPLTLESILYGVAAAGMLAAVMLWFSRYSDVMTSDKFVYLFGRIIPALSLVLSMTLRFIPRFTAQLRAAAEARQGLTGPETAKGRLGRLQSALTLLSILVTWSLENAVETADSMKSRGYGLPGRTSFSIYRFDGRDRAALGWLCFCGFYIVCGWVTGGFAFRYYPTAGGGMTGPFAVSFQLTYLALCLTPVILNRMEARKWKHLTSEI